MNAERMQDLAVLRFRFALALSENRARIYIPGGDHLVPITVKSANAAFAKWTITAHGLIIVWGRKIRGKSLCLARKFESRFFRRLTLRTPDVFY